MAQHGPSEIISSGEGAFLGPGAYIKFCSKGESLGQESMTMNTDGRESPFL